MRKLHRRDIVLGAVAGTLVSTPALACKAPSAKDRSGYTRVIDEFFTAWWARDYAAFEQPFLLAAREPFDARTLFDAYYEKPEQRFRGELLFNGPSVIAQVVTPQEADYERGICGGYALADLFLITFFPGADVPVIESVAHVNFDLLASAEWGDLPGALR